MNELLKPLELERPRLLHFGPHTAREIGRFAKMEGLERALIVCDPFNASRVDVLDLSCTIHIMGEVVAEPDTAMLASALQHASDFAPDFIVGFGGGSAMDLAKIVSVLHNSEKRIHDVVGVNFAPPRLVRLGQVATTAGTGSEAGTRSLITDAATHAKLAVQSSHMLADIAVLDPMMTATVPSGITAETGIDALTHCVEAFTNQRAHPLVDLYAREGIRLVGRYLRRAVENGSDLEARAGMALASLYGGYCLGPVNTAAGHAIAYPLSTRHGISHGAANAIIFPHVLAFNAPSVPQKTAEILALLGLGTVGENAVFEAANQFCEELGIQMRLSQRGVPVEDFQAMASEAAGIRRLLDNNPRDVTPDDIMLMYEAAL